ncbi:transmembrane protein 52 [Eublepharis macularius]|uniref:Transmembrane protein 52 n=1 Tax=Eublepharis macularius TaxID=481883 RepID=A0AA97KKS4_EUBMA|nr:transmembrane protein 52 [Eublepharis macularius]
MAAFQRGRLLLLLALLQAMPSLAEICSDHSLQDCSQQGASWTSLWYVWLILLTVFLLLMCGIGASCVKFCCRKKRPPVQTFPPQAHDLTAIPIDHDSTAHSTVTSYSSVQYPQSISLPMSFREMDRNLVNPPAYSLYAIDLPPSYDEAIKMAKPCIETPFVGQKFGENTSQSVVQEEQNQPQTSPEMSNSSPEIVQPGSQLPEASTQEQPEL